MGSAITQSFAAVYLSVQAIKLIAVQGEMLQNALAAAMLAPYLN